VFEVIDLTSNCLFRELFSCCFWELEVLWIGFVRDLLVLKQKVVIFKKVFFNFEKMFEFGPEIAEVLDFQPNMSPTPNSENKVHQPMTSFLLHLLIVTKINQFYFVKMILMSKARMTNTTSRCNNKPVNNCHCSPDIFAYRSQIIVPLFFLNISASHVLKQDEEKTVK